MRDFCSCVGLWMGWMARWQSFRPSNYMALGNRIKFSPPSSTRFVCFCVFATRIAETIYLGAKALFGACTPIRLSFFLFLSSVFFSFFFLSFLARQSGQFLPNAFSLFDRSIQTWLLLVNLVALNGLYGSGHNGRATLQWTQTDGRKLRWLLCH